MIEKLQESLDDFENVFIFTIFNNRNVNLKSMRDDWKDSKFFIGKNKIMSLALGTDCANEHIGNLHKVSKLLKGECGLLLTNHDIEQVRSFFEKHRCLEYARSGCVASRTVVVEAGAQAQFGHTMEPQLRKLGLPVKMLRGVIQVEQRHVVCRAGQRLTPEQCSLLKHFSEPLAEFRLSLVAHWQREGAFQRLSDHEDVTAANVAKGVDVAAAEADEEPMEDLSE